MSDTPRTDDDDFAAWKAERDRQFRTRGKFVLTDEGRKQARQIFDEDSWVLPLLDKVEELEREVAALRKDAERYRWLKWQREALYDLFSAEEFYAQPSTCSLYW